VHYCREGIDTSSIVIYSNQMRFDEDGVLVGFSSSLVHSRNKHTFAMSKATFVDALWEVRFRACLHASMMCCERHECVDLAMHHSHNLANEYHVFMHV
jgi:hypothetical protein